MIYLYSGTPGSGKSLNVARDIVKKLRSGKRVIANFPINLEIVRSTFYSRFVYWFFGKIRGVIRLSLNFVKVGFFRRFLFFLFSVFYVGSLDQFSSRKLGDFLYLDNSVLTAQKLLEFAKENHVKGREGQTLLVIDECAVLFNCREFTRNDRAVWIKFFQMHRHLGYNVVLISQNDRLIDRQIRAFIEYDCKHRKANNFGNVGFLFSLFCVKLFVIVTYWYGVREKCSVEFFTYRKLYSKIYDSYAAFDRDLDFSA